MIKFSEENQEQELKRLWQTCFADDINYIDLFFEDHYSSSQSLVYMQNGKVVSMLFLLSANLCFNKESHKAQYIYAACTHPDYRKKGYMRELIEFAVEHGGLSGTKYTLLTPASKKLYDYYSQQGFKHFFKRKASIFTRNELSRVGVFSSKCFTIRPEEIIAIQKKAFANNTYVSWGKSSVEHAIRDLYYWSGRVVGIKTPNNENIGYAFCQYEGNSLTVSELGVEPKNFNFFVGALLNSFAASKFTFTFPANYEITNSTDQISYCGMIRSFDPEADSILNYSDLDNNYIGFTLE